MSLDGTNWKVKVEPLQRGLAGLKQLGDALRCIPPYWEWNFAELGNACGTQGCAAGLAHRIWPDEVKECEIDGPNGLFRAFNLPSRDLYALFGSFNMESVYGNKTHCDITPHDVADAIDRYIAGKGGVA